MPVSRHKVHSQISASPLGQTLTSLLVYFSSNYESRRATVTVESPTNLGFGIARVPLPNISNTNNETNIDPTDKKWVVFIPNVIPGESVCIRIYRNHAIYSDNTQS
jgi:predicted RNA-binding protein with TRAM domain